MNDTEHQRRALTFFATASGQLLVGSQSVEDYFSSPEIPPTFLYARKAINDRLALVRKALPPCISLHYAVKANPFRPLLEHMSQQVDGFDVASEGELALARLAGGPDKAIGFAGPGKSDSELRAAIADGCTLQTESAAEFQRTKKVAEQLERTANTALRINPDFELRGSGMKMAGSATPFGMVPETAVELLRDAPSKSIRFSGLHIYAGSQCLDAEAIGDAQEASLNLAADLLSVAREHAVDVNIGGGFGIPYFARETALDIATVGQRLSDLADRFCQRFPNARVIVELGRYLVGEAGVYLTRVLERKVVRNKVFLVCDGGLHHHLAASGNFGQVIRRNYPVLLANRLNDKPTERVTVVGRLCTPLDVLADSVELPRAEPGDIIAVFQSGAYGRSASPQAFLGHPNASEVLV